MDSAVRRPYQHYPEEFRLEVVKFYFDSGEDRAATLRKFGIDHASLRDWLRRYGDREHVVSLYDRLSQDRLDSLRSFPEDPEKARRAYSDLLLELDRERSRSEALSELISQAEEEYGLPIRTRSWRTHDFRFRRMSEILGREVKQLHENGVAMTIAELYPLMQRVYGKGNIPNRRLFRRMLEDAAVLLLCVRGG